MMQQLACEEAKQVVAMADSGGQVQLTKKVLKEFVREQCRDVGQVRRTRPKKLALQEQASRRELGDLAEAESPPLLLSPGPRSHAQSDPQEPLSQSDAAQAVSFPSQTMVLIGIAWLSHSHRSAIAVFLFCFSFCF